jgi:hypothetical protein
VDESSAIKQLNQLEKRTDTIGNKILKKLQNLVVLMQGHQNSTSS